MELFELRYFLAVARVENVHRASEQLHVSPASLSKAVARLEDELSARLFTRQGRNIRLTDQGRALSERAAEILRLEESARLEIAGHKGALRAVIAGSEVLLTHFAFGIVDSTRKRHSGLRVEYQACDDRQALERVVSGDAHLALVTTEAPRGLANRTLGDAEFKTAVGLGHPLHARAHAGQTVDVAEVLKHGFACPNQAWLGQVGANQSSDGWRDDQFPRRIEHQTSSLKLLERLATSGQAVVYLPDYLIKTLGLAALRVSGCPYHCRQTIRLVAKKPKDTGWLNALFPQKQS